MAQMSDKPHNCEEDICWALGISNRQKLTMPHAQCPIPHALFPQISL